MVFVEDSVMVNKPSAGLVALSQVTVVWRRVGVVPEISKTAVAFCL